MHSSLVQTGLILLATTLFNFTTLVYAQDLWPSSSPIVVQGPLQTAAPILYPEYLPKKVLIEEFLEANKTNAPKKRKDGVKHIVDTLVSDHEGQLGPYRCYNVIAYKHSYEKSEFRGVQDANFVKVKKFVIGKEEYDILVFNGEAGFTFKGEGGFRNWAYMTDDAGERCTNTSEKVLNCKPLACPKLSLKPNLRIMSP